MRRWVVAALVGCLLVLVVAYLGAGYVVYTRLAKVRGSCERHLSNRPDNFANISSWPLEDFTPYFMPVYEDVQFPSRQPNLQIAGWYVEAEPDAPVVIVVDGIGGCKYAQAALLSAGMLWHSGFNILLIDLRDTGDSGSEDGLSAVGNEEYQDALGAWDWLVEQKGFAPERIGILGNSLGVATVLFAFEQEPRIAAIALNSPFANLPQIMREELQNKGYPSILAPGAVVMARLVSGEDLVAHDPVKAALSAGDRPIWVVHSTADSRVAVHHSYALQAATQEAGVDAEFWFIDGASHVQSPAVYPAEFQTRLSAFFRDHLK
jgi:dipeptidyl aminopeptidase/acylaminoacyl peptidase